MIVVLVANAFSTQVVGHLSKVTRSCKARSCQCNAHLKLLQELVLLLRQTGQHANDAADGAKQHCGNLGSFAVRQLHHQAAMPKHIDKLAHMILAHNL